MANLKKIIASDLQPNEMRTILITVKDWLIRTENQILKFDVKYDFNIIDFQLIVFCFHLIQATCMYFFLLFTVCNSNYVQINISIQLLNLMKSSRISTLFKLLAITCEFLFCKIVGFYSSLSKYLDFDGVYFQASFYAFGVAYFIMPQPFFFPFLQLIKRPSVGSPCNCNYTYASNQITRH